MTRRLFVAVWLPEECRREAAEVLGKLREREERARWVVPENLHVTLAFLGDVDEERLAELERRIAGALESARSFPIRLGRTGSFGKPRDPRVVWVAVDEGAKEIAALASRVERTLVEGKFLEPSPRPFAAHVTLGRPKGPRGFGRAVDLLGTLACAGRTANVQEVTLAESRLTPRGSQYEVLARFPLSGSPASISRPHEGENE